MGRDRTEYAGVLVSFDELESDPRALGLRLWLAERLFGGDAYLIELATVEAFEEWEAEHG